MRFTPSSLSRPRWFSLLGFVVASVLSASAPQWWTTREVLDPNADENNKAIVNQGQAKWMVTQAIAEMNDKLGPIGGAGFQLGDFLDPGKDAEHYAPLNIGQLKNISAPFYDRLNEVGYPLTSSAHANGYYPWSEDVVPSNYYLANVGQLKHMFSWDLKNFVSADTDGDGMLDYLEQYWFGNLDNVGLEDSDFDGVSNYIEELAGTDPQDAGDVHYWPVESFYDGYDQAVPALFIEAYGGSNDGNRIVGNSFVYSGDVADKGTVYAEPRLEDLGEGDMLYVTFEVTDLVPASGNGIDVWFGEGIAYADSRSRIITAETPGGKGTHGMAHNNHILKEEGEYKILYQIDEPVLGQVIQLNFYGSNEAFSLTLNDLQIYYIPKDSDGDHFPDGWELANPSEFAAFPGVIGAEVKHREQVTKKLYLNNPTASEVNYTMTTFYPSGQMPFMEPNQSGEVLAYDDKAVYFTLDSKGLAHGRHNANIEISHDSAGSSTVMVPVIFDVLKNPPSIEIIDPVDETEIWSNQSIYIKTAIRQSDLSVKRVEFYNGEIKLGEDVNAPYALHLSGLSEGEYEITAHLIDDEDEVSISDSISISVHDLETDDADSDGVADSWVNTWFDNPSAFDPQVDSDGDKVSDYDEYLAGTNPMSAGDSDFDGLPDDWEIHWLGTLDHFADADPDLDLFSLKVEFNLGLNPVEKDTVLPVPTVLPSTRVHYSPFDIIIKNPYGIGVIAWSDDYNDPKPDRPSELDTDKYIGYSEEYQEELVIPVTEPGRYSLKYQIYHRGIPITPVFNLHGSNAFVLNDSVGQYTNSKKVWYGSVYDPYAPEGLGYRYEYNTSAFNTSIGERVITEIGYGWIKSNNTFVPDYSKSSQILYDGAQGIPANNGWGWRAVRAYSVKHDNFPSYGKITSIEKGWITSYNTFVLDKLVKPKAIYEKQWIRVKYLGIATLWWDYGPGNYSYNQDDLDAFYPYTPLVSKGTGWITGQTSYKLAQGLFPVKGNEDEDNDGLTGTEEWYHGTHPHAYDTDNDGLNDGYEISNGLNPKIANNTSAVVSPDDLTIRQEYMYGLSVADTSLDEDGDGLSNLDEIVIYGTDPTKADTDGDGVSDYDEIYHPLGLGYENPGIVLNPSVEDTDGDGLSDLEEIDFGTNPLSIDSDDDGIPDGWEVEYGFDPLNPNASDDSDNDGLTNLQEYEIGTNPLNEDTDGDLLPDGFEYQIAGLDPLVFNNNSTDLDEDGLTEFEEFLYGTDPNNADSDGDGINDGAEVESGSDPLNENSKPFNPSDFIGVDLSDANINDIGDVDIKYQSSSNNNLSFSLGGDYASWEMRINGIAGESNRFYRFRTDNPGDTQSRVFNIIPNSIYEINLQWISSKEDEELMWYCWEAQVEGFPEEQTYDDYSNERLYGVGESDVISSWIVVNLGGVLSDHVHSKEGEGDNIAGAAQSSYLIPVISEGWSESVVGGDAVGSRYRKVSLSGRPLPDEKPEEESETEEYKEETYVDAFDLSLRHDTSYIYTPLAASDLTLEVNASVRETIWTDRGGLRPHEELTSPFGVAWSSNLAAYVEVVETLGDNTTDPIGVTVVDEGGRSQRFGTQDLLTFFPWPSARVDKKTYLNRLVKDGSNLVLHKKYGHTLTYTPSDAWFMYSTDRLDGSDSVRKHTYWRLQSVEDRYGNKIVYDYGSSNVSLIPELIQSQDRSHQWIAIDRSSDGRRVDSVTDSRGNTIEFNYSTVTETSPLTEDSFICTVLTSVDYPDGTSKSYDYEIFKDEEITNDTITNHYHCNINEITDKRGNEYAIDYVPDRDKAYFSGNGGQMKFAVNTTALPDDVQDYADQELADMNDEGDPGDPGSYKMQYGLPRLVSSVTLPGSEGTSTFAKTSNTKVWFGPEFSAESGTIVTDALGNETHYVFEDVEGEVVDTDYSSSGNSSSVSMEWMVYYKTMSIHHGALEGQPGHLGTETFEFDLDSGLSLSRVTDISGNVTEWKFEDAISTGPVIALNENPNFTTTWSDPTEKTDALGRVETYEYASDYRIMSEIVDVHGTTTTYGVDSMGRRTSMIVRGPDNAKLREETYLYDDQDGNNTTDFAGFMVEKRVVAFDSASGESWEDDLVTRYVPDSYGRVAQEIVDPGELHLVTSYTYDLNNNRTSVTDPRGNTTTFTYDEMNRLVKVTYPPAGTKNNGVSATNVRYFYDYAGNKAAEINEEGNVTLYHYDEMNRRIRAIQDMDGAGLPTFPNEQSPQVLAEGNLGSAGAADIVTENEYNAVGSLISVTDPRGYVTRNFYDALQRVSHIYTHFSSADANSTGQEMGAAVATQTGKTHTEYQYSTANNTGSGVFDSEGFRPTTIIMHDYVEGESGPITVTTNIEYDGVFRQTSSVTTYASGREAETTTQYGARSNGKEALETITTDPRGKKTFMRRDGLGRTIEIIDGYETASAIVTEKYYTSTGLEFLVIDPMGYEAATEYDAAGRPTIVWQPDPVTGQVDKQPADNSVIGSPKTETIYDDAGNVSAMINPRGERWDYAYDARNRKIEEEGPAVTDAEDENAPLVRPVTETHYDGVGNVIEVIDPRGATATTEYDRANRPVQTTTPVVLVYTGGVPTEEALQTEMIYDKAGNIIQLIDAEGNSTVNHYDPLGRLEITVTNPVVATPSLTKGSYLPDDVVVVYEHDDAGNQISVTDGEGARTAFYYDGLGRNTHTVWDEGSDLERVKELEYDDAVLIKRTDEKGQITEYTYDDLNRLATVEYTGRSVDDRAYTYDDNGNILSITYPNETTSLREVAQTYDALGRVTSETSVGVTHTHVYDKAGNRLSTVYGQTDREITSTYDALNRLKTLEETDGSATRTTTYAYNLTGGIVRKELPNGVEVINTFDALGRTIESENRTNGADFPFATYAYEYDRVGNIREIMEGSPAGTLPARGIVNTYDRKYRLISEVTEGYQSVPLTGDWFVYSSYGHNLSTSGGITTVEQGTNPERIQVLHQFPFTDLGASYRISVELRVTTGTVHWSQIRNSSNTSNWKYENGTGSLMDLTSAWALYTKDVKVKNEQGRILIPVKATSSSAPLTLEIRNLEIFKMAEEKEVAYAYDKADNRISKIVTGGDEPGQSLYTYGDGSNASGGNSNQLISFTRPDSSVVTYTYDANGNRATRTEGSETDTYSYDYENRLLSLDYDTGDSDTGLYEYAYDHRTRRVLRDESAVSGRDRSLIVFAGGTSVQEHTTSIGSSPAVEYVRGSDYGGGIGGILYTLRGGAPGYNHYNSRGDVVAKTSPTGSLTWQAQYEAFGMRTAEDGSNPDRQKANTKDEDPHGLLNEGFRYRDLETGTFITRDPLGFVDGPNVYTYVVQNPWTKFDPLGLNKLREGWDSLKSDISKASDAVGGFVKDAGSEVFDFGLGALNYANDASGFVLNKASGGYLFNEHAYRYQTKTNEMAYSIAEQALGGISQDFQGALDGLGQGDLSGFLHLGGNLLGYEEGDSLGNVTGKALLAGGALSRLKVKGGGFADSAKNKIDDVGRLWNKSDFNGTRVYQRDDLIDPALVDSRGRTNLQRMQNGLAPVGPDGYSLNLHHTIQSADSPLAEVTRTFHQQNSSVIHINANTIPSGIDRNAFNTFRREYWMNRANDFAP